MALSSSTLLAVRAWSSPLGIPTGGGRATKCCCGAAAKNGPASLGLAIKAAFAGEIKFELIILKFYLLFFFSLYEFN
jgi:hypothetical protein